MLKITCGKLVSIEQIQKHQQHRETKLRLGRQTRTLRRRRLLCSFIFIASRDCIVDWWVWFLRSNSRSRMSISRSKYVLVRLAWSVARSSSALARFSAATTNNQQTWCSCLHHTEVGWRCHNIYSLFNFYLFIFPCNIWDTDKSLTYTGTIKTILN